MTLHTLLSLDRPLISLDFETTGINVREDRIVSIGVCKLYPNGDYKEWETLVNPTIPIPAGATAVHHITDEMVREKPTFRELHLKVAKAMENCDICGYNEAKYDAPLLTAEFFRCGFVWEAPRMIDAFRIYQRMHPMNLTSAVERYLGEKLEGAHGSLADARAAMRVLTAQLEQHTDLPRTVQELHDLFFTAPRDAGVLDPDGKLAWKDGKAVINFGKKHPGKSLQQVKALDSGFLEWMIRDGDFNVVVKRVVREALEGRFPKQP